MSPQPEGQALEPIPLGGSVSRLPCLTRGHREKHQPPVLCLEKPCSLAAGDQGEEGGA